MRCLLLLALAGVTACSKDDDRGADAGKACDTPQRLARHEGYMVQVGAFADSANAAALAATLVAEGWQVDITPDLATLERLWRVRVIPGQSREAADLTAYALRARFPGAGRANMHPLPGVPTVWVEIVNLGTHGMAASSRWAYSPDGCALIVVEDPVSVEADALPNAFIYAHDGTGVVIPRSPVWDVAPSADWKRIGYSRAYTQSAREQDSLSAAQWSAIASRADWPEDSVRRAAFQTSGMAYVYGVARPVVEYVDSMLRAKPEALPILGGWRIGWRGDTLAIGLNPRMTNDAAPASGWLLYDAPGSKVVGRADSGATMDAVAWEEGPTLDISIAVEPPATPKRPAGASGEPTVRTRDGWIEVHAKANTDRWIRVVPGVALATTRAGRSVVALVPWPEAREYDHKWQLALVRIQ